ncbi:pirin family protein [Thalassotalea atypica]|uniref:pirin family protein n=1 Tax=Thalassotalea atypica TaxID=2054316 RepID=UPI002573E79D|nr:pirin-like bicupin family protein [Thalassotalea atypica]
MIKHIPFQQLGKANHGWLKANHHFSFGQYYNARRMGFGKLRVINDDEIAPQSGFPEHPHKNMEIISYIRSGAITHTDSRGNEGVTSAGQVQVMSAGQGIWHSEYNLTKSDVTLFQIWIEPNKQNVPPRWDTMTFPAKSTGDALPLLVSGYPEDKNDALFIHQYARIYGGLLARQATVSHSINDQAYVLASKGSFEISDGNQRTVLNKGDGAEITLSKQLEIRALVNSELLIIDTP